MSSDYSRMEDSLSQVKRYDFKIQKIEDDDNFYSLNKSPARIFSDPYEEPEIVIDCLTPSNQSEDFKIIQEEQPISLTQGRELMKQIIQMINGEGLFANEEVPEMAAGIDIIIEKPLDENEKPVVIDEFSVKWQENDVRIKDYFEHTESALPLCFFDVNTSYDLSYKLEDTKILIFDKKDNSLKIFNTLKQEVNKIEQKKYAKSVLFKKTLNDIINLDISSEIAREQKKFYDLKLQNAFHDSIETATRIRPSADKRDILLGTSYGKLLVLDSKDFRVKYVLNNPVQTPVTDVIQKQNFVAVGYQNGQIIVFKRQLAFQAYKRVELQEANGLPIRALKLSPYTKHFVVIQETRYEEDKNQNKGFKTGTQIKIFNFKLTLYDQKKLYEIGDTILSSIECLNFELKKYIDFSEKFLYIRSRDTKSFSVYSLENLELISQGPELIDNHSIQLIQSIPQQQQVLLVGQYGDCYYYDFSGKKVDDDKHNNEVPYMITPFGQYDSKLISLKDRITLCKLRKKVYSQIQIFRTNEQVMYFSDEKESFIIQLAPIKADFDGIISAKISADSKVFAHVYHSQNTKFMDLTDMKTATVLKTFKQFEPVTSSFDNQYFICQNAIEKTVYKVNLKNMQLDLIEDVCTQMICASKFDNFMFYMDYDELSKKYSLALYDLYKKTIISQLDMEFDNEFFFQISNDEKTILISTKDGKLIKVSSRRPRNLKVIETINHQPGFSTHISFDAEDELFMTGGYLSGDVIIYNLQTMKQIQIIDNHVGINTTGYFVERDRMVTKNDDKLIYWKWNGKLQMLFQNSENIQIIQGYNRQLAGLVIKNEISLWSQYLTHELTSNILAIQPNDLKKEWTVGPLIMVYPLIINYFLAAQEDEKIKLLPHILKYVVLPHGFTILSKLVYTNQKNLVKAACKIQNQRYIRDINGNTPLLYALKRRDYESIDSILQFLAKDVTLLNLISFSALLSLIEVCPSFLIPFLESTVTQVTDNMKDLGKKIDESHQTYYEYDPQERLRPNFIYEKLFDVNADETTLVPIVFKQSQLGLNCELGSTESIIFSQALADCQNEAIFRTAFVRNLLAHKWIKMKPFANFLLFLTVFFTATISVHSFSPGQKIYIDLLKAQNYFWALIELIIYVQSGYSFKYNGTINIALFIVLNIYCFFTLDQATPMIDNLLPLINWMAWFQMVLQLQQFETIRTFVSVFLQCIGALAGFNYFLILMIFTFATTQDIIQKNMVRQNKYKDAREPYSVNFYEKYDAIQSQYQNFTELWDCIYETWIAIIKGDFKPNPGTIWRFFVYISTFISTVVLLNLIIAFMADSYSNVMVTIEEKKNKTLNGMTLRLEKVMFWNKKKGKTTLLVWGDYANAFSYSQQNQEVSDIIYNETQKQFEFFEKTCKNLLYDLKLLIIQSRQKISYKFEEQQEKIVDQLSRNLNLMTNQFQNQTQDDLVLFKQYTSNQEDVQTDEYAQKKQQQNPEQKYEIQPVQLSDSQLMKFAKSATEQISSSQKQFKSMNKKCDDQIISLTQELSKMIVENNQISLTQQPTKEQSEQASDYNVNQDLSQIHQDLQEQLDNNEKQIQQFIDDKFGLMKNQISGELLEYLDKNQYKIYKEMETSLEKGLQNKIKLFKMQSDLQIKKQQNKIDQFQQDTNEIQQQIGQLIAMFQK